jgi:hypothetical protein
MIDSATGDVPGAGTADTCCAQGAVAAINGSGGVLARKLRLTITDDQSMSAVAAWQGQKLTGQGTCLFAHGSTSTMYYMDHSEFTSIPVLKAVFRPYINRCFAAA